MAENKNKMNQLFWESEGRKKKREKENDILLDKNNNNNHFKKKKKNKKTHNVDAEGKKLGTDTIGCDQLTRLTGNLNFKKVCKDRES